MPLCQSAEVKGSCEGRWFMYLFCSQYSLVAAVCQVYREGDCSYISVSFGWDDPAVFLLWLTHCSCLLISTSIMAPTPAACRSCPAAIRNNKTPQSLRQQPWILLLCRFHHHISTIYFTILQRVNHLPNKSLLVKTNINISFWKQQREIWD